MKITVETVSGYCECCGRSLHPETGEPIEHGKMKICQACHAELNWFKRVRTHRIEE